MFTTDHHAESDDRYKSLVADEHVVIYDSSCRGAWIRAAQTVDLGRHR